MIQGADSYIVSAYAFAYVLLIGYGLTLRARRAQGQRQLRQTTGRGGAL